MKTQRHILILLTIILLLSSCSTKPTAVPVADAPEPTPELIQAAPSPTPEIADSNQEDPVYEIEETKTTLLVYSGDVRVSADDGNSWSYTDSGYWLETGDRIQISEGGLALILFPDGSLIRLEGFTDFKLVLNEFDFETGTKRIICRVLDGSAMISTIPLPNPDSLFQFWLMTSLIDLPFNQDLAVAIDQAETVSEDQKITFGGTLREDFDGESIFSYSHLVDFYTLEVVDGEVILIKTKPLEDQFTQYEIPFREDIEDEFELEGLLDMAAGVIEASRMADSITELDYYGYSMIEEGELSENQILYSLFPVEELDEFLEEAGDPEEQEEFVNYVRQRPAYKRHQLHYRYYKDIADIFSPEILLMLDKYKLGCDIKTGLGCPLPPDCNRETGAGCELLESGCNPITRAGCKQAKLSCIAYTNCDWAPCGRRPVVSFFCKPRVRTYCDPDIAGDCDKYILKPISPTGTETGSAADTSSSSDDETAAEAEDTTTGVDGLDSGGLSSRISYSSDSLPLELVQSSEKAGENLIDPNDPISCQPFYNQLYWLQYDILSGSFDDWGDEEDDIEWCTCTAQVPPGYPPPPPSMDMTYRCWCSDPGAH